MRTLWIIILLLLPTTLSVGQPIFVTPGSYHYDNYPYEFTNKTPGVGIGYNVHPNLFLGAGAYKNSVRTTSVYAAFGAVLPADTKVRFVGILTVAHGYQNSKLDPNRRIFIGRRFTPLPFVGADVKLISNVYLRIMGNPMVATTGIVVDL